MTESSKRGFVLLSHQGLSQVGPLATELKRRGYRVCVLSSRSARGLQPDWLGQVDRATFSDGFALTSEDVDAHMESLRSEFDLVACISVWDAYRPLMAEANSRLGACDISLEVVNLLRDKLAMRKVLLQHGLTSKRAVVLDSEYFNNLIDRDRYFIKPRTGMASFGAFRADRIATYGELETLRCSTQADAAYSGAFTAQMEFIVEDYIQGTEFSFEVSVSHGNASVHAIHEKVDLRSHGRTTLENACVCPPQSLDNSQCEEGKQFVSRCLDALGVSTGVYHIEARYSAVDGWEIIEVNPRIGGAYIVDSTFLHSNVDLLACWVGLLLGGHPTLNAVAQRSTFFRVFFGQGGRTVRRLTRNDVGVLAVKEKFFVKEGEVMPDVEREIFVGQALWDISTLPYTAQQQLIATSESYLSIEYNA
jgi:hypothetical protein